MPSPFPGMNPYLEPPDVWADFHTRFITEAARVLGSQLRPHYLVKIEQRIYIHELPPDRWRLVGKPDVSVHRPANGAGSAAAVVAIESPAVIEMPITVETVTSRYLEVVDRHSRDVVAVLELLSPSNKYAGPDRDQYLEKRTRLFQGAASFIEIDLLRGGPRMPLGDPPPACDYYALVSRAVDRPRVNVWPLTLRDRLPEIPIPVPSGAVGAWLDLQQILHQAYDAGTFDLEIYGREPEPRFSPEDAAWARQFVPGQAGPNL